MILRDFAETGNYAADCKLGRQLADQVLADMREKGFPPMLGTVVRQMIEDKRYSGIEIGFCHRIAERAMIEPRGDGQ